MTYLDLARKLNDAPFRPFRIKLSNNTAIDVWEPGSVIIGRTSAVLPIETVIDDKGVRVAENWRTISISHIVEFSDLNPRERQPKRKGT